MWSNFSKFYQHSINKRQQILSEHWEKFEELPVLPELVADQMIENYIGNYSLPLGVAMNFVINDKPYIVPMAVEEPSVVAAASNGARFASSISTQMNDRNITGQIVITQVDMSQALTILSKSRVEILEKAKMFSPTMVQRGGGPKDVRFEVVDSSKEFLTIYLDFDPCDAMGANSINTVLEGISTYIQSKIGGDILMSILSNYSPNSLVSATMKIPIHKLSTSQFDGIEIAKKIVRISNYAKIDPYRAATHNKGIMNGIDAVLIATGNDWRAVEASVHSYASIKGRYQGLSEWIIHEDSQTLEGKLEIPMPLATVGGTLSVHPIAQWSLNLLGNPDAKELSQIVVAVGLVQNFSALRAIVSEGIQQGHMKLQARSLALQVGAHEHEVEPLIKLMTENIPTQSTARYLLKQLREKDDARANKSN